MSPSGVVGGGEPAIGLRSFLRRLRGLMMRGRQFSAWPVLPSSDVTDTASLAAGGEDSGSEPREGRCGPLLLRMSGAPWVWRARRANGSRSNSSQGSRLLLLLVLAT